MVCKEMRSTIGCMVEESWVKNELHLVTDGHDKKLKLKQPFFKCCEEVRATPPQRVASWEKNSLSCSMNLVEKPAFPNIFQLARGKTTPPNTHSSPRNPVWYLRISNAVPSRLFLRYVSADLMFYHQPFKLVQIVSQVSCKVVVHDVHLSITSIFESSRHWNCCGFSSYRCCLLYLPSSSFCHITTTCPDHIFSRVS